MKSFKFFFHSERFFPSSENFYNLLGIPSRAKSFSSLCLQHDQPVKISQIFSTQKWNFLQNENIFVENFRPFRLRENEEL